jgi:hypothetical protein
MATQSSEPFSENTQANITVLPKLGFIEKGPVEKESKNNGQSLFQSEDLITELCDIPIHIPKPQGKGIKNTKASPVISSPVVNDEMNVSDHSDTFLSASELETTEDHTDSKDTTFAIDHMEEPVDISKSLQPKENVVAGFTSEEQKELYQQRQLKLIKDLFEGSINSKNQDGVNTLESFIEDLIDKFPWIDKITSCYLMYQCAGDLLHLKNLLTNIILSSQPISTVQSPEESISKIAHLILGTCHRQPWNREIDLLLLSMEPIELSWIHDHVLFGNDSMFLCRRKKWLQSHESDLDV